MSNHQFNLLRDEYIDEITRRMTKKGLKINEGGDDMTQLLIMNSHISNVLKEFAARGNDPYTELCHSCNEGNMVFQGGCATCDKCGHSECG